MHVTSRSKELLDLQIDPAWSSIAGVYLRRQGATHSLACSFLWSGPYWSLKRYDWPQGELTGPMLDELGAVVADQVVQGLMRVEGVPLTLWDPQ